MTKLDTLIKIAEIKIPNTDIVIKVKTELTWLEVLEFDRLQDIVDRGKYLISHIVVDWNLEDEKNEKLPITEDNIKRLPASIGIPLADKISEIVSQSTVKKNS